jgi:starvation-inducible DNA-binding protein
MLKSPNFGLSEKNRQGVIDILTTVLADEHTLYTKLRKYHWNITGPQFFALHELFEQQYNSIKEIADTLAERARAHGGNAIGTLEEFLDRTRLDEEPGQYPNAPIMVSNLVQDHERMVRNLREDARICAEQYHDVATEDLFIGIMQEHEEMSWMLRSFIEEPAMEEQKIQANVSKFNKQ